MDSQVTKITQQQLDILKIQKLKRKFHTARTQARFRGQAWTITQPAYIEMWLKDDNWLHSGWAADDLVFSRLDMTGDWTQDNVHIITRRKMLDNEGRHKKIAPGRARKKANNSG